VIFFFDFPPGTGKTTVARKIGQVFYDMGILGTAEVVECSSSDLVGQYVGQTGPKTKELFEKALGKVLFIDEAYRLAEGHFAQEAIDELVGLLTHANFKSKLIVILAGYEQDMNRLLSVNTGLSSRFPDQVVFSNMGAEHCIIVLKTELQKEGVSVVGFDDTSSTVYIDIKELIRDIAELKDWGNARDMVTLSKEMIGCALRSSNSSAGGALEISGKEAVDVVKKMLQDRQRRTNITSNNRRRDRMLNLPQQSSTPTPPTPPATGTAENTATAQPPPPPPPPTPPATQKPPRMPAPQLQSPPRSRGQNAARGPRGRNQNNGNGTARTRDGPDNSGAARQPPANAQPPQSSAPSIQPSPHVRDPGVSDGLWRQMEAAKRIAAEIEQDATNNIKRLAREVAERRKKEDAEKKRIQDLQRAEAQARDAELQRQQEEARLKEVAERAAREKAAAELRARQEAERQRKEQEAREEAQARDAAHRAELRRQREEAWRKELAERAAREKAAAELRARQEAERQRKEREARAEAQAREAAHRAELRRQQEEARRKALAERAAREKAAAELRARQEAERQRKEREARAQQKLRELGVCPHCWHWLI